MHATKILARSVIAACALLSIATAASAQRPDPKTAIVAFGTDAQTLDPQQINSRDTQNIADHVWASLYEIDDDGKLIPYVAESFTESDTGKELTFKIRSGLTCHDGSPLTAEDVAFTFQRAKNPANKLVGSTPGFVLTSLGYKNARAVDANTAVIEIENFNPIALGLISEVKILCKKPYEAMSIEAAGQKPVGSGPYRFVEWVKSDRIVIEKVANFPLRQATFDKIVFRVIPEASARGRIDGRQCRRDHQRGAGPDRHHQ